MPGLPLPHWHGGVGGAFHPANPSRNDDPSLATSETECTVVPTTSEIEDTHLLCYCHVDATTVFTGGSYSGKPLSL